MVNLHQKAKKEAALDDARRHEHLRAAGYTVFRFDLAPRFTRANLSLGDAFRELKRVTGYKVGFWRCPIRGLALNFQSPPTAGYIYDAGVKSSLLTFSTQEDEVAAKRELVLHCLLLGIENFRGLPNSAFLQQTAILRNLLTAPVNMAEEQWLAQKARLHPRFAPLLDTHAADLRKNLL